MILEGARSLWTVWCEGCRHGTFAVEPFVCEPSQQITARFVFTIALLSPLRWSGPNACSICLLVAHYILDGKRHPPDSSTRFLASSFIELTYFPDAVAFGQCSCIGVCVSKFQWKVDLLGSITRKGSWMLGLFFFALTGAVSH